MKKAGFVFLLLLSVFSINAQIKSFVVDASKVYDNNTRTVYLTIEWDFDNEMVEKVSTIIQEHPDIKLFSFYNSQDYRKLMFTSDLSIDEAVVVDLINDAILSEDQNNELVRYEFAKSENHGGEYIVSFKIEGISSSEQSNRICDEFKKLEIFNDILIDFDSNCTLRSNQVIDYSTVNHVIRSNGAMIDSEYVIKSSN
jgi:hypothetical protein